MWGSQHLTAKVVLIIDIHLSCMSMVLIEHSVTKEVNLLGVYTLHMYRSEE